MQNNVDDLMNVIETSVQAFMVKSIESETFDEFMLKDVILKAIQTYRQDANWQDLSMEERTRLLTAITTVENSIGDFISFASFYATKEPAQIGLRISTRSRLKDLVKKIVKSVVITVALVSGTLGGLALGAITCAGPCMIIGGVGGFVAGAVVASSVNRWIDRW